jgi:hypothetical protein
MTNTIKKIISEIKRNIGLNIKNLAIHCFREILSQLLFTELIQAIKFPKVVLFLPRTKNILTIPQISVYVIMTSII